MYRLVAFLLAAGIAHSARASFAEPMPSGEAALVVTGTIVDREEVWDRRSNPLMGRPDFLTEIRLRLASLEVHSGSLPGSAREITVSIKGEKRLLASRSLNIGMSGEFQLGGGPPYELLAVDSLQKLYDPPKPPVKPAARATPAPPRPFPENARARELKASPELQKKAVRVISERYGMSGAKMVFLTSFQGPMPPEGGYLLWGVIGKIRGKKHVWQPGWRSPRPGSQLVNPHAHQK